MEVPVNIDIDEMITYIVEHLPKDALAHDPKGGNRSWTLHLKLLLEEYGKERYELDSEYSNRSVGMSEFLIDFLWWDRRNESQQQMVLAVESEWYNIRPGLTDASRLYAEEVAKDFYKLMVVKSPYKLMTLSSEGGASRDLIVKRLEQDVATFVGHVKGEQYILLDSSPKDDWAAYQLLIAEDGVCRAHFSKREIRRGQWQPSRWKLTASVSRKPAMPG